MNTNFNLHELEDEIKLPGFDSIINTMRSNIDDTLINFLKKEGYEVPKIITTEYVNNLKSKLEKEDRYLDIMEKVEYSEKSNGYYATQYLIPFFNCISNPLSEKDKEHIIEEYIRRQKDEEKK